MTMQPCTPEEWAELHGAVRRVVTGLEAMNSALTRHTTALTYALVFLMQELEARGGLDRAALAEMTIAGLRLAQPENAEAETERAVRDLFGQGEGPRVSVRPGLRVIEGGKG